MPYISVKTQKTLTAEQKDDIKSVLGEKIAILPGKSESWLMVEIEDRKDMWFRGDAAPCAMIDVSIFGEASQSAYDRLTSALCESIGRIIGVPGDRIYVRYSEVGIWGWNGSNF